MATSTLQQRAMSGGLSHELHHESPMSTLRDGQSSIGSPDVKCTLSVEGQAGRISRCRERRSLLRRSSRFALAHTWATPLALLLAIFCLYVVNPTESNTVHHFIFLSYGVHHEAGVDSRTQYGKGPWDIAFVCFYTIVLTFTREFIMQEALRPLARYCGLKSRGKQQRFMEQMYTAVYFGIMGPVGIYVMSQTPVWYFDRRGMYEGYPHQTLDATFKFYYLFEAAYWVQQVLVMLLGLEQKRKDHNELVVHHIVTISLISVSYAFHFTHAGIGVYLTHDISDFFLAISKSCSYIDSPLLGPVFGVSTLSWIYLRHYQNLRIILGLFTEFRTVGPYEFNWEAGQYKCPTSNAIIIALLSSLQALNLYWLSLILRIAYRFVVYNSKKDERSEAEESEMEAECQKTETAKTATTSIGRVSVVKRNDVATGRSNGVIAAGR